MKLPNYSKSTLWTELFDQMDINTIRPFKVPQTNKKTNIKRSAELKKGIKISSIKDVEQSINQKDQSLQDSKTGEKLVFHIEDIIPEQKLGYRAEYKIRVGQEFNYNLPKYHIANCSTIQGFKKNKKFDTRYIMITNSDGLFTVISPYSRKKEEQKLTLCLNCRNLMARTHSHEMFKRPVAQFSLSEYHEKYDEASGSILNKMQNTKYNQNYTPQPRSKNWSSITTSYREKMGWTCEICNSGFRTNKRKLETHHMDGDRSNDVESNLKALCKKCHDNQPGHSKYEYTNSIYKPKNSNKTKIEPININKLKKKYDKKTISTEKAIKAGEGQTVEFKKTLLAGKKPKSNIARSMVFNIFKSIAAFLNSDGGKLIIGVDDNGMVKGIKEIGNQFKTYDEMDNYFGNTFSTYLPSHLRDNCKWKQELIQGKSVFVVNIEKCTRNPVFILLTKHEKIKIDNKTVKLTLPLQGADTEIIIRSGAQKVPLKTPQSLVSYTRKRFPAYHKWLVMT